MILQKKESFYFDLAPSSFCVLACLAGDQDRNKDQDIERFFYFRASELGPLMSRT